MSVKILVSKVLPACYKGDLAIAKSMLATISQTRPDWELLILCRRPLKDADIFSPYGKVYGELFPPRGSLPGGVVFTRVLRYLLWLIFQIPCLDNQGREYVNLCREANILVFCGGGSPGGYGVTNLFLHAAMPILMAKRLHKPVCLSGLTIELPKRKLDRLLTRFILKQVDLISLREMLSVNSLEKLGVQTKRVVTADWAFLLDNTSSEPVSTPLENLGVPDNDSLLIGMNLRDQGSGDSDGKTRVGSAYATTLTKAITEILEQTEAVIVVVSMNVPSDLKFANLIYEQLPNSLQTRVILADNSYSPEQIKSIISAMDIFIGTRLHPTLFALSSQVPSIAIHHLIKVKGLMKLFGLEKYFLEVDSLTPQSLNDKVQELIVNQEDIRQEISNKLPSVEKAVYKNIEMLESLLIENGVK